MQEHYLHCDRIGNNFASYGITKMGGKPTQVSTFIFAVTKRVRDIG
jgi:hypothetical protein